MLEALSRITGPVKDPNTKDLYFLRSRVKGSPVPCSQTTNQHKHVIPFAITVFRSCYYSYSSSSSSYYYYYYHDDYNYYSTTTTTTTTTTTLTLTLSRSIVCRGLASRTRLEVRLLHAVWTMAAVPFGTVQNKTIVKRSRVETLSRSCKA